MIHHVKRLKFINYVIIYRKKNKIVKLLYLELYIIYFFENDSN